MGVASAEHANLWVYITESDGKDVSDKKYWLPVFNGGAASGAQYLYPQ